MISTFLVESGIVEEESGMEPISDTSALRRHVPLPGYNQGGRIARTEPDKSDGEVEQG